MSAITAEELRRLTLERQFPAVGDCGPSAVLRLLEHLGPLQSQVPRAPFVTLAARLPGTTYETICGLFESFRLLRASNLRGTVHTSTRPTFGHLDGVASVARGLAVRRALRLGRVTAADVDQEVRRFCTDDWRARADVVRHIRSWLAEHDSPESSATLSGTFSESVVWGNSGLLRRPRGSAWETRTDAWHRTAHPWVAGVAPVPPAVALPALVRGHLAAHGPVTRDDLAFFFGVGLTAVDRAVAELGDELVRRTGPEEQTFFDLAEPPAVSGRPPGGRAAGAPGLALLPEFDALLLGFCGRNRTRFVEAEELGEVWAKANGLFSPVVLHEDRLVGTWRTRTEGKRTVLEATPLTRRRLPAADAFTEPVADLGRALGVRIADVRVLPDRRL